MNFLIAVLDDSDAEFHSGDAAGVEDADSIVINHNGYVGLLHDISSDPDNDDVVNNDGAEVTRFILTYDEAQGIITLEDADTGRTYEVADSGTPVDVSHVMVSTSDHQYIASWRICGLGKNMVPKNFTCFCNSAAANYSENHIFSKHSEMACFSFKTNCGKE